MATFAVVPVKNLLKSKTRLSTIFTSQERSSLTLAMLQDVLNALKSSKIHRTIVISSDIAVNKVAEKFGVKILGEMQDGLNQAVDQTLKWCFKNGAESVLILPVDIPLITSKDINRIINLGLKSKSVVISPSQNGGTNALLQTPPRIIPPCFGSNSFKKHLEQALNRHIRMKAYQSLRVSLDIDSERDLKRFLEIGKKTVFYRLLEQIMNK